MKNIYKKIIILIIIVVVIVSIVNILNKCNKKRDIKEIDESKEIETSIHKELRGENNYSPISVLSSLITNGQKGFERFDDYLTEHFKEKYKTKYDIMPECDETKVYSKGESNIYGCEGLWERNVTWHDETKPYITTYYYRFDVTPDRQLNDFELVKKVDRDPNTHARLDGVKEITNEDIRHYLAIYTTPTYFCYKGYEVENYQNTPEYMKYHNIPLTPNCEVINKPERVYYGYLSGNDIYTFYCPNDVKKYYKIDFKLNDNLEFERIEYIDVTNE